MSVLCGYKTWDEIEEFGHLNIEWFRQYGGFVNGVPSHDTLARIVSLIDPDEFSLCFTRWCNEASILAQAKQAPNLALSLLG